jgi:hypothetical protein
MSRKHRYWITGALLVGLAWWILQRKVDPADQNAPQGAAPAIEPKITVDGQLTQDVQQIATIAEPLRTKRSVTAQEFYERTQLDRFHEWKRPIEFYGKVVDENGEPVRDAAITFTWNDLSLNGTSQFRTMSDDGGYFSLSGIQGKGLSVFITNERYYVSNTHNKFAFEYANPHEPHFHEPDPHNPVIFHLRSKGRAEALVVTKKSYKIPKDGSPVEVQLTTGTKAMGLSGQMRVECWTVDAQKDAFNRYDWKCRVSVPSGGLIESTREFDFEAPAQGYQTFDQIDMPQSSENWRSDVSKWYFLKLPDGTYARLHFRIIAGGDHFFKIQSFVNPSGSRNLEYDPAVQPKPTFYQ